MSGSDSASTESLILCAMGFQVGRVCWRLSITDIAVAGSYSPSITVAVTKSGGSVQTLNLSVPNWTVYPNDGWLD
jgi:hypothetical protein